MTETKDVPIRDASTVIVMRDKATRPRVLMGQRGAKAAFMPNTKTLTSNEFQARIIFARSRNLPDSWTSQLSTVLFAQIQQTSLIFWPSVQFHFFIPYGIF